MRVSNRGFTRYVLAALLTPLFGEANPFHTVWLAVVICAVYFGIGPSIVATLVCVVGVDYFFLPPLHSLFIHDRSQQFGVLGFVAFSAVIIAFGEANRKQAYSLMI